MKNALLSPIGYVREFMYLWCVQVRVCVCGEEGTRYHYPPVVCVRERVCACVRESVCVCVFVCAETEGHPSIIHQLCGRVCVVCIVFCLCLCAEKEQDLAL